MSNRGIGSIKILNNIERGTRKRKNKYIRAKTHPKRDDDEVRSVESGKYVPRQRHPDMR